MLVYARPADVGVVVDEAVDDHAEGGDEISVVVYLAPLPDGPVRILNGVASLIWLEATAADAPVDLVERIAALVDRPPDTIRADVESFLSTLVQAGLLETVER